jgi:hypothetical protein
MVKNRIFGLVVIQLSYFVGTSIELQDGFNKIVWKVNGGKDREAITSRASWLSLERKSGWGS